MSKNFMPSQQRLSTQVLELLAVVLYLQNCRYWMEGAEIIVRTEHESLASYRTRVNITPRILRFLDVIEHYNPKIIYRKSITNLLLDYLSRPPFRSLISKKLNSIH